MTSATKSRCHYRLPKCILKILTVYRNSFPKRYYTSNTVLRLLHSHTKISFQIFSTNIFSTNKFTENCPSNNKNTKTTSYDTVSSTESIVEYSLINGKFFAYCSWVRAHQIILKLRLSACCEQPFAFEG